MFMAIHGFRHMSKARRVRGELKVVDGDLILVDALGYLI